MTLGTKYLREPCTVTNIGIHCSLIWKDQTTRGFLMQYSATEYRFYPQGSGAGTYFSIDPAYLGEDLIQAVAALHPISSKTADQLAREAHQVVLALAEGDHDAEDPAVMRAVRYFADDWRTGASILPFELGADAADRALDEFTKALADLAHFEQSYRGVRTLPADYVQRKVALEEAVKAKRSALRTMLGVEP